MNEVVTLPIRFDAYTFAPDTGELAKNGRTIALRPQATQILQLLTSHPGRLVTREDLRSELWAAGTYVDFEHGLNLCIHEIRAALHDDANSPRYIETLPRRGYRFIGPIQRPAASPAEVVPRKSEPVLVVQAAAPASAAPRSALFRLLAVLVFVCAAAAAVVVSSRLRTRETGASPSPPAALTTPAVALLPLADLGGRPEEEYFADGISWELHRQLESVDSLRVSAFWSSRRYKKAKEPPAEIARKLKASHLVSGSVTRHGDRALINLVLTEATHGRPLWAQSYQATLADLPQVESRAVRAIAENLLGTQVSRIRKPAVQAQVNAEAHAVLLRAMAAPTMKEYRQELERAVAIDPQFALGWSLLSEAYVTDTWFAQTMPPVVGYPKAKEYALKALALDESDSLAHTILATVKLHHEWDWAGAEREFRRAIELSPSCAFAHHIYSHYLLTMDRLEESVIESRIASDLDPLNPTLSTCVGWHCLFARQYDDAVAECLKLINDQKAGPITHYYLGRVYVRQGKLPEGIAALEIAEKSAGRLNSVVATLAYAYAQGGRRADAERALAVLKKRSGDRYVAAFDMAIVYAGLGDKESTFEWLERAYLERSTWLVHIKWDDRFAGVRGDPRFVSLLKRMGIPHPEGARHPEPVVPERFSPLAVADVPRARS
jgi:TolB-like protein/DNA-binding winged helix-turn-helix (wHTH) protein/Flp pilus assembly protein TadD